MAVLFLFFVFGQTMTGGKKQRKEKTWEREAEKEERRHLRAAPGMGDTAT
jgi:hypothetical protein